MVESIFPRTACEQTHRDGLFESDPFFSRCGERALFPGTTRWSESVKARTDDEGDRLTSLGSTAFEAPHRETRAVLLSGYRAGLRRCGETWRRTRLRKMRIKPDESKSVRQKLQKFFIILLLGSADEVDSNPSRAAAKGGASAAQAPISQRVRIRRASCDARISHRDACVCHTQMTDSARWHSRRESAN